MRDGVPPNEGGVDNSTVWLAKCMTLILMALGAPVIRAKTRLLLMCQITRIGLCCVDKFHLVVATAPPAFQLGLLITEK